MKQYDVISLKPPRGYRFKMKSIMIALKRHKKFWITERRYSTAQIRCGKSKKGKRIMWGC